MTTSYSDSFLSSFSLILVSEIGDKTFFIASLLAMQHANKILDVFAGAISALFIMTVLSTGIGLVALQFLSPTVTALLSSFGLLYFAISIAHKLAFDSDDTNGDGEGETELEEVEKELRQLDAAAQLKNTNNGQSGQNGQNNDKNGQNNGKNGPNGQKTDNDSKIIVRNAPSPSSTSSTSSSSSSTLNWSLAWTNFDEFKTHFILHLTSNFTLLSPVFIKCCVLTFIAEWGDRSQVATILLSSAAKSPLLVTIGCILGHMICTSIAISFGKILSTQLNDRHLQLVAAVLFFIFGLSGVWSVWTGQLDHQHLPRY